MEQLREVVLMRRYKYEQTATYLSEFFGGSACGLGSKKGHIWFKVGKKRVYLDVKFGTTFKNIVWGGNRFIAFNVKWIRVRQIGEWVPNWMWIVEGVDIPVDGYVHEDSKLYSFLVDLKKIVKAVG